MKNNDYKKVISAFEKLDERNKIQFKNAFHLIDEREKLETLSMVFLTSQIISIPILAQRMHYRCVAGLGLIRARYVRDQVYLAVIH